MESSIIREKNTDNNFRLVSILMAVYNPNYDWFREQLISLNNQSYKNLELIIYDDDPNNPVKEEIIAKYITKFKYTIIRGKVNKGSNKAFEELTRIGHGDYFAYCDQDDIWESDKIDILVSAIESDNAVIVYSDMSVIDEKSKFKYNTLIKAKPRINYICGENLVDRFFFKNCVSGCCMLIKKEIAKAAIPFSNTLIHDQWLCLVGSLYGNISFIDKQLVRYRMHGKNQTGSLKGIATKQEYYDLKVNLLNDRINDLKNVIVNKKCRITPENREKLNRVKRFCDARIDKKILKIFSYRELCKSEAYFEIAIKYIPSEIVKYILIILK